MTLTYKIDFKFKLTDMIFTYFAIKSNVSHYLGKLPQINCSIDDIMFKNY